MIHAFHRGLSAAWSHSARVLDSHRRRFLALGTAAASVACAAPAVLAPVPIVARPPEAGVRRRGYRETQHVRHYYRTTRL